MKFVHSLDDNVLTHLAGGLTALVATATALFSGPLLLLHMSTPDSEVADTDSAEDDTAPVDDLYQQPEPLLLTEATTAQNLNDRSNEREKAVDAMNVEIDVLLQRMKDKPQRRR